MKKEHKKTSTHSIRNYFIEGLVVLLPLSLTFYAIFVIFRWLEKSLSFTVRFLPQQFHNVVYLQVLVEIAAFIIILIFILFMGWLAKTVLGRGIGQLLESIIHKLPGINSLYKALKQLFRTFVSYNGNRYSKAVLIQYPQKDIWSIAFLTSEAKESIKPNKKKEYYTVFMPSTPNPTTGFLMIVPKKDVILLDISIEETIKILMSGGLLHNDQENM